MKTIRGVTLVELMVALMISSVLIAALYRTFVSQQRMYTTQEQVVDIQQNVRVAINRMVSELRASGFGNVRMVLPVSFTAYGKTRNFSHIVNPDTPVNGALSFVSAIPLEASFEKGPGELLEGKKLLSSQFIVSRLRDDNGDILFDTGNRKYISIGGVESHAISEIDSGHKMITLNEKIVHRHSMGTPLFGIRAVSYQVVKDKEAISLKRDENMGGGRQPLAENVEDLQFEYVDGNGNSGALPETVRLIKVTVTARSDKPDPGSNEGDGYRRRKISSSVYLRNMGPSD